MGTTDDPATPYAWAVSVSKELDHGVLLTRDGEGHVAYFSSACVRGRRPDLPRQRGDATPGHDLQLVEGASSMRW